jgi:hypothetical protein
MTTTATPAVATKLALRATVSHEDGCRDQCPTISKVGIWLGDLAVASATLGGKYNERQALSEFVRCHKDTKRFHHHAAYGAAIAAGYIKG